MTAGRFNIIMEQGATFSLPITVSDVISGSTVPRDLTDYTARMKIKQFIADSVPLVELTTENFYILMDPDQVVNPGKMLLTLPATVTEALDFSRGVYDLELVNDDVVERVLEGKVIFRREVTD